MRKLALVPVLVVVSGAAVWVVAGTVAQGATAGSVSIAAATMQPIGATTHNNVTTPACGAPVASTQGSDNFGVLINSQGSALAPISLPQGATVTAFRYTVRDSDADFDTYAYLASKRLGKYPTELQGYSVLASVHSKSASSRVRQVVDTSIANALIDNTQFAYYVETVTCASNLEPIGIQVDYTTP